MTDSNEVQALESISNAVDDSQLKIILTTQCIKAQSLLVAKLRKQSEHQKEVCSFINSGNLKLKTEIRNAEQKIKSMITALETIKSANVELHKELLLSKEQRSDIVQRVNNGIKKYENLWQEAKEKYENIPFIKHYLETKNETQIIKQNIATLLNDSQILSNNIIERKKQLAELDRSRILEIANYLVNERSNTLRLIKEKQDKIDEINKEIAKVVKNTKDGNMVKNIAVSNFEKPVEKVDKYKSCLDLNKSIDDSGMVLPKLELCYIDLDLLSDKLDKIKKSDSFTVLSTKATNQVELHPIIKKNDTHDDYEMILIGDNNSNAHKNYSEKKLINILDDIKINNDEAKDLMYKVKQSDLRDVNVAEVIVVNNIDEAADTKAGETTELPMTLEEIDLTPKKSTIIGPPSQFLDLTEYSQKSDIIITEENPTQNSVTDLNNSNKIENENILNESKVNTNNIDESDRSFEKIKDSILKKHKLNLSPQFVYSKKPMTTMKPEDVVTSKFFNDNNDKIEHLEITNISNVSEVCQETQQFEDSVKDKEVNNAAQISQKINIHSLEQKNDIPISGFLFNHGADGIIQLSNTSLDTTGYGDGENDFPSCIDSSLLLSPKADLDVQDPNANDVQVLSQEVPNFLSGLRKTGFSFFGSATNDEASDIDTKPLQSNFSFNFGGEQKKTRGGLFSMFR